MLKTGIRYFINLESQVVRQRGYRDAFRVGIHFIIGEIGGLVRRGWFSFPGRKRLSPGSETQPLYSDTILHTVSSLPVDVLPYNVVPQRFEAHVNSVRYPPNYAAGSLDEGGAREQKLLEYFVSLDLLDIQVTDVVIDVASEWSMFPEVVRNLTGAAVYQQDMIYPAGKDGYYIGGNAAHMPVGDCFADKLVLHNAFEHFEGTADSDFIKEAWRILKPGGKVCILPLFIGEQYAILSDPLVNRKGIHWDEGAKVIQQPGFHNRFARFYDISALARRVLTPGQDFHVTIYHVENIKAIYPRAYLYYVLVMQKPVSPSEYSL